ncbi:Lrp/AsnC family transcriptional regulator [Sphingomonas sp. SRS2]|uniref:Lrp/AsnC family transcriptional regulator n=1 Tax=Sphingomonas sp. SRS2 TaxID=133190 RepID=UPI000A4B7918|nr:Lrp/AsnC family transcriptional regulator [Sphingomonas sp. SRS2]
MSNAKMDDVDRRILAALQEQPDLTTVELGNRVGLSHTPCWRRLKRLEAQGVVKGRALMLDAAKLGFKVNVFANIKLNSMTKTLWNLLRFPLRIDQRS